MAIISKYIKKNEKLFSLANISVFALVVIKAVGLPTYQEYRIKKNLTCLINDE